MVAGQAKSLSERYRALETADIEVFEGFMEALRLPRASEEEKERAQETEHSTAAQAAQVALAAKAKQLVLTHLSARYSATPEILLREAKEVFADTVVARDGMTIEVPFVDG